MNIDRRPIVLVTITNGNWSSLYKPEYNPWGYSDEFRKTGVQGVLNKMDILLGMGYRRLCAMKPIGTNPGDDVAAAAQAMHPHFQTEWQTIFLPWIADRKSKYPDLVFGFYTGSAFEDLKKLNCDPNSPNLKIATDTSTPTASANYHGCHDFLIETLKADFLILDKGSYKDRVNQSIATANKSACKLITEAVRPDYALQLPMMARTTYWYSMNIPGISPDAKFDPNTTEIHWWLQKDFDVPAGGPSLSTYIQNLIKNGIIPSCQYPFAAQEIIDATKPGTKRWWHLNKVRTP